MIKIATWNVERLKHKKDLDKITQALLQVNADILVLTETDSQIKMDYSFSFSSPPLVEIQPDYYKSTENRITIYSRFPCLAQHRTYDEYTALCVELETPLGNLFVYGTIMGIFGNRHGTFLPDVEKQMADIERLSTTGKAVCVVGDYNCSFGDNYYFTKDGRTAILDTFSRSKIDILTSNVPECIDHIAISSEYVKGSQWEVEEWNLDKKLSDHKGIVVEL